MRAKLIAIGNSRGIRLPKALLEQYGLKDEVELEFKEEHVILRPLRSARRGWEAAFKRMRARGDDALLDAPSVSRPTSWEQSEWAW